MYLGDGGRCFCGAHAGCSALYTGHDVSGQPVVCLSLAVLRDLGEDPRYVRCEECGREVAA